MIIRTILHKALRRLVERNDGAGFQPPIAQKLRRMIAFLQDMETEDELESMPHWGAHKLSGSRQGVWSLTVTRNWRLTFSIDQDVIEIIDLNYEDYH